MAFAGVFRSSIAFHDRGFLQSRIGSDLRQIAQTRKIQDRPIEVRSYSASSNVATFHILFLPGSLDPKVQSEIIRRVAGKHILLVGEDVAFITWGGGISLSDRRQQGSPVHCAEGDRAAGTFGQREVATGRPCRGLGPARLLCRDLPASPSVFPGWQCSSPATSNERLPCSRVVVSGKRPGPDCSPPSGVMPADCVTPASKDTEHVDVGGQWASRAAMKNRSIKAKLSLLTTVAAGVALSLSTIAFLIYDIHRIRSSKCRNFSPLPRFWATIALRHWGLAIRSLPPRC